MKRFTILLLCLIIPIRAKSSYLVSFSFLLYKMEAIISPKVVVKIR